MWALAGLWGLGGCARETYDVADLQLDVDAPLPAEAETLHVCVATAGTLDAGAGNGRLAFTGLESGAPAVVSLTVLDDAGEVLGGAGPATLDAATPYVVTPFRPGEEEPCAATGGPAPEGTDTWLLVMRFAEGE